MQGSGPLDDVDVNFSLDADQDRIAKGTVALRARDDGLGFDVDFGGGLAPLVPPQFRDFFAGQSTVRVSGVKQSAGGFRIDQPRRRRRGAATSTAASRPAATASCASSR